MDQRTKRILSKTSCVTLIAVVATYALSISMRWAMGMPMDWLSWVECLVIPIAVGTPIGWYVFSQAENLRTAHERLERSHQDLNRAHERLAFVASHDQMTGLLSRDGFLRQLEQSRERNAGDVLLIADADHFKRINDRYGHPKGDEALVKIAKALRYAVRRKDIVGRIGGEEFAILLVSVGLDEAKQMADLIRRQVQCIPWQVDDPDTCGLTISIGGAALDRRHVKAADLLRQADRCLYEAKRLGRNRVEFDYAVTAVA
jgi:diguanylate cyclase (GGDEF)-like protein